MISGFFYKHFLQPTMILFLAISTVLGQESSKPAVDGINGSFDVSAGITAAPGTQQRNGLGLVGGAISIPLGHSFGLQVDATANGSSFGLQGGGAAHLFWRNPDQGLLGAYGAGQYIANTGFYHLAAEAELYVNRLTIGAIVGSQFAGPVSEFFDHVTLSYYPTDNLRLSAGHVYAVTQNAASLSAEYLLPQYQSDPTAVSIYAQALIGERSQGFMGGIKIYFGTKPKTLIRRHREDDPTPILSLAQLQTMSQQQINSYLMKQPPPAWYTPAQIPPPPPPPTSIAQYLSPPANPMTLYNIQQQAIQSLQALAGSQPPPIVIPGM